MKKIVVLFHAPGFTAKQYDKVWDDLKKAGYEHPKGLISHVGFAKPDNSWMVVDVWESKEAFNEFSKTLLPIIEKTGVKFGEPQILPAHNVYVGQTETAMA